MFTLKKVISECQILSFEVLFLVVFAVTVSAQEIRSISLEEAVEIALVNNIEIKLSESNIERSKSEVRQRRAEFFPNLNASIGGTRTDGRQFDPASIRFDDITSHNINAGLNSNVTIFNGFQNINHLRSTRVGLESAEEKYQHKRETIIFETASRFLDVLLSEELLEIEIENLETSRRQWDQVIARVGIGMRPIVEQYSQEAIVSDNELSVIRSENRLSISKLLLARWLQLDPLADYNFEAPKILEENITIRDYELKDLVEFAINNRRDVRASELDLLQTRYALKISEGTRLPEVRLGASLSTAFRDQQLQPVVNGEGMEMMPFSDQFFEGNINRSIYFSVDIPIFNRRQTSNQIQQNKINYREANLLHQDLQQEIFVEVRQAYNDYVGFAKEMEVTEKALIAAEKAYEAELGRYNIGSSTLLELTSANNTFIQASSNRIQVMYQLVFQEKLLDYYLGRITADFGNSILVE